jgi:deoxyribose-phosphate aldolase
MLDRIDHTLLRPDTTEKDIDRLIDECKKYGFRGICIPPTKVDYAVRYSDYDLLIATVIGFPLGYSTQTAKLREVADAIGDGANEVDVVWNIGDFKDRRPRFLAEDLAELVDEANVHGVRVKIIVEECLLTTTELEDAWHIVYDSGAYAIKTSTGWGKSGATLPTVRLWDNLRHWNRADDFKIKAAGGIKTASQLKLFIDAGADIIGTSNSVAIAEELRNEDRSVC